MSLLSPILYRAALLDRQTQLLSRPWQQYFQALDTRVGGSSAPTILELEAVNAALTLRIAVLEAALASLLAHSGTPTVAAVAAGAGEGAVVSVSGTDLAGVLTLTTADRVERRSHSGLLTVTFATAWATAPVVQVLPANAAAEALVHGRFARHPCSVRVVQAAVTTTTFALSVGVTSLPREGDSYVWSYSASG